MPSSSLRRLSDGSSAWVWALEDEDDDTPTQNIEPAIDIEHLSPDAEYLESGRSLISNPRQRLLRWVGSRS